MRRASVLLLLIVSAAACARVVMPRPTTADAVRAESRWPGTSLADLEHGRSLYLNRCTACHQPVSPGAVPPDEWPMHVNEMRERAHLDAEEADVVIRYLVTMASAQGKGGR
jgi:cytochrome c5